MEELMNFPPLEGKVSGEKGFSERILPGFHLQFRAGKGLVEQ